MSFFANNFLICPGVEKCGTTSLHAFLRNRSSLIVPEKKELFFFNSHFDGGEAAYRAMFTEPKENPADRWYVDITPSYFRQPKTLQRLTESLCGNIVIVFLIRNPVKRAFSFYWHDMVRHTLRGEKSANRFERFTNCSFQHFIQSKDSYYLTTYAQQLTSWMNAFPDRCAIHLTEDIVRDTNPLIDDINRLCGLSLEKDHPFPRENEAMVETISIFPKGIRRHTSSGVRVTQLKRQHAINAMAMQGTFTHTLSKTECEEIFERFFADDLKRCEDLLERDLSILKKQSDLVSPIIKSYAAYSQSRLAKG